MGQRSHRYGCTVEWTGNTGAGTRSYSGYSRDHLICAPGKPSLGGSSDPAFRGDAARYNPEELLVASLSSCHMLWYLHLACEAGVVVTDYRDEPVGEMVEDATGSGHFTRVTLRPAVTIAAGGDAGLAARLHADAHARCFIANSVNFPVVCHPTIRIA